MRINTNVSSLSAQEAAANTNKRLTSSLDKLSTGLRINKASDDASGLAIADKLRTQATSINQGIANGNSAVSLLQIADKSMAEQSNILDTIKSKLIQANTDTTSADGRESIRKDIAKLLEQLDNIAEQTNYNGNVLLQQASDDKTASAALSFQIGESNRDIITNTSIQSNTDGLGSKTIYSAANQNNTIAAADSVTVAGTSAINLTATTVSGDNTAESVTLSGDVDTLTLKAGMTLSGMNAATLAAFTSTGAGLVVGTDYTQSGTTYTMLTDQTLDFSSVDDVNVNLTTPAETSSTYTTQVGDTVTAATFNDGSEIATALLNGSKFLDNLDGTYTAKTAEAYTLEPGESVDYSRATTQQNFSVGQIVTLTADVVAGGELDNALNTAAFTLQSGTAGENGAVYSVNAGGAANIGVEATESFTLFTPVSVSYNTGDIFDTVTSNGGSALATALADNTKFEDLGNGQYQALTTTSIALEAGETLDHYAKTEMTTDLTFGDIIAVASGSLTTGSDLHTLLNDTTKFTKTDNGSGTNYYKYASESTYSTDVALAAGESITVLEATSTAIGTAKENATITLTADVIAGSDLALQLADTNAFTLTSSAGTAGKSGATYTVNVDYSTDKLLTVEGEGFTITEAGTIDISGMSASANITQTISFTPDGGVATNYDWSSGGAKLIADGGTAGDPEITFSQSGYLSVQIDSSATGQTATFVAGDRISIGSLTETAGTGSISEQIIESGNWELVSGAGATAVYQATAGGNITFAGNTESVTIQRRYEANAPADSSANTAADTITSTSTTKAAAAATPVTGAANTTGSVAPSDTVTVSFTTSSTVDVTNNGSASNTLTMSSASEINNGGTQLNALAAIGAGQFTQELADSFQAVVDDAITSLNAYRGDIGSTQNQVESAVRNLMTQATNVKAAESIIRDVDYAQESANFNKQNIIAQAGAYAMSQANAVQQNVLRLLQ